jgi:hypothetical protein
VLVYVALDLSLPAMPGAFVFEIDGTVESTQETRTRPTASPDVAVRPQPLVGSSVRAPADAGARRRRTPGRRLARPTSALPTARAAIPPAPPVDEPH